MKRFLVTLCVVCCITTVSSVYADNEQDEIMILRKADAMAIVNAAMGMASNLLTQLPPLIQDIDSFPDSVKKDALALEQGIRDAAKLLGDAKQKKIEELFIYGVNLTILVTNIVNKLMLIISGIGPLAKAIDPVKGAKINDSMLLAANIMQMIAKINVAMKKSIIETGKVTVSTEAQQTPKLDPIPDL